MGLFSRLVLFDSIHMTEKEHDTKPNKAQLHCCTRHISCSLFATSSLLTRLPRHRILMVHKTSPLSTASPPLSQWSQNTYILFIKSDIALGS